MLCAVASDRARHCPPQSNRSAFGPEPVGRKWHHLSRTNGRRASKATIGSDPDTSQAWPLLLFERIPHLGIGRPSSLAGSKLSESIRPVIRRLRESGEGPQAGLTSRALKPSNGRRQRLHEME